MCLMLGLQCEGIFRLAGSYGIIEEIIEAYNNGNRVDFDSYDDPHTVAAVLKRFFKQLPEPVITYDVYKPLLKLWSTNIEKSLTVDEHSEQTTNPNDDLRFVIEQMEPINKEVIRLVLSMLYLTAQCVDSNKMTADNLAIVWGPNLLKGENESPLEALQNAKMVNAIVAHMIDNFHELFPHEM